MDLCRIQLASGLQETIVAANAIPPCRSAPAIVACRVSLSPRGSIIVPDSALVPERLAVRFGDQETVLTPTQFRILPVLMGQPNRVFSRAELVEHAIGTLVSARTVDVHIKEIRRKLGLHGLHIETVRRAGYRYRLPGALH
jgi:DNA-binding response OmpR family regulator